MSRMHKSKLYWITFCFGIKPIYYFLHLSVAKYIVDNEEDKDITFIAFVGVKEIYCGQKQYNIKSIKQYHNNKINALDLKTHTFLGSLT